MNFSDAQTVLARAGMHIAAGLTDDEFVRVERQFGFRFPSDLRAFLAVGLPLSAQWVDWRSADEKAIRKRLDSPLQGICSDIEHNAFWSRLAEENGEPGGG